MTTLLSSNLTTARRMSGMTMTDLARESGLSKQAISKFESGDLLPQSDAIIKLANALDLPHDFLFNTQTLTEKVTLKNISLREGHNIGEKDLEEIKLETIDFLIRYIELEKFSEIKQEFKNPIEEMEISSTRDVERAVKKLRKKWNIGNFQIPNIIELLERKGIKIYELERPDNFNGFAAWAGEIPIIVVNSSIKEVTRIRFTTLHELGHIVLRFIDDLDDVTIEKFCDIFSAELLFSTEAVVYEFGPRRTSVNVEELKRIKEKYGISFKAIIKALYRAKVIDKSTFKGWFDQYRQLITDQVSLGKYAGVERPQRFKLLLYGCINEGRISIGKAAALAKMKERELRKEYDLLNCISAN